MRLDPDMKTDRSWRNALVAVGIAFSLPGTIGGPMILGYFIDSRYQTGPLWLSIGMVLGLIAAVIEIRLIMKKMKQME
jgi:F0F1-type ATP synthase assembly protein I